MSQELPKESMFMSLFKPFMVGSISGCLATSVIQPVDTIKVNIQSIKETAGKQKVNLSPFHVGKQIISSDGVAGNVALIQVSTRDWILLFSDKWSTVVSDWDYTESLKMILRRRIRGLSLSEKK